MLLKSLKGHSVVVCVVKSVAKNFSNSFSIDKGFRINPTFLQLTVPLLSCRRYPFEWIVKYVGNEKRKKYVRPRLPVEAGGAHPMKFFYSAS